MKIGLLLNSDRKLCPFSKKYEEALIGSNLPYTIIDPNSYSLIDDLKACTHLIFRHSQGDTDAQLYDLIYNMAKRLKVKCMPEYDTFWAYENKVREYYMLKMNGFPIVESRIFWNSGPATEYLKSAKYPFIAKLSKGAGSENVVMVKSFDEAEKIVKQVFHRGVKKKGLKNGTNLKGFSHRKFFEYSKAKIRKALIYAGLYKDKTAYPEWQIQKDSVIFQKFLPGNSYDTRITIIGKRAFGFRRSVRKNDFRASGSGIVNYDPSKIDLQFVRIAFEISRKLNFTTMAYDCIYDENRLPFINEISYCFVADNLHKCPGYWDEHLLWHEGRQWPQYYQIEDFLEIDHQKKISEEKVGVNW
jgi:glutathione synthase/RimK-type ligase-like ATP-grasp enzyme